MAQSKRLILKNVRCSYVNVFAPRQKMSGEGVEYSAQLILPKSHPQLGELKAAIGEVAKAAFPKLKLGAQVRPPLRDADAEGKAEDASYLKGTMFMNARSQSAPQVVDGNLRVLTDPSEFFSGCFANVSVTLFSYDTSGNKGVGVSLNNLQRCAFGERLDGRKSATDEFEQVEESGAKPAEAAPAEEADVAW